MKSKTLKRIIILITCFLMLLSLCNNSMAAKATSVIDGAYKGTTTTKADNTVKNIITSILSVVRTVAAAIAIIILIVIACKYILASAGDRADIKKYAFNYIVGAIILFAASGLLSIAKQITEDALGE